MKPTSKITQLFLAALTFVTVTSQSSFSTAGNFSMSKDCKVHPDQSMSFSGFVANTINLLADNRFNKDQKKNIQAAVDSWNAAGMSIAGRNFFNLSFVDIPASITKARSFPCQQHFGDKSFLYLFSVGNESQWGALDGHPGSENNAMGITLYCPEASSHEFDQEIVVVNTANSDRIKGLFQTIVLHELGHSLGLLHSCDGTNLKVPRPDYISCKKVYKGNPYYDAVMYLSLVPATTSKPLPDVKQKLTPNDLVRLQCLYGPR